LDGYEVGDWTLDSHEIRAPEHRGRIRGSHPSGNRALVALSILFAILVAILRLIGHLSLRGLLASCAILALAPVVSFTSQDLDEFGLANMLISLASFWTLSFVSLGLGTITWWLLARSTTSLRASSATPGAG
jgi:hypothetical protein